MVSLARALKKEIPVIFDDIELSDDPIDGECIVWDSEDLDTGVFAG